ncbi:hypothetical protein D3C81_2082200 [compost metagenome]
MPALDGIEQTRRWCCALQNQPAQLVRAVTCNLHAKGSRLVGNSRCAAGKPVNQVGGVLPALRLLELMHPSPGTIVLECW